MNRIVLEEALRSPAQAVGLAIVVLKPLLEDLVHGDALPCSSVLGVHWLKRAKLQYRLGVEGIRVRFQPIELRNRDPPWPLVRGQAGRRTIGRMRKARIIEAGCDPLELDIARQAAAHGT
jgi:hypothetical protein